MPGSEEQTAWLDRVLGATAPKAAPKAAPEIAPATGTASPEPARRDDPFQIFVKSVDGVTLTLRLPDGAATPLGTLRDLVEARSGLSLDETTLMVGTKPFRAAHAALPVSEYGVQRNQTLFLQGALKGGFGERAAMADAILRDIHHGNVLGDIEASNGASRALKNMGRQMLGDTPQLHDQFCTRLLARLQAGGQLPHSVTNKGQLATWIGQNKTAASAATASELHAGNCAEYANVAYTSLLANTTGQFVYRASMTGTDAITGQKYDHAFVVTSPNDHGTDVAALAQDPDAIVADPWWQSTVCSFGQFVQGHNPYGAVMDTANLLVRKREQASGQPPIPPAVEQAIRATALDVVAANPQRLANLTHAALTNQNGVFGQSGDIWNRTQIKDDRAQADVLRGFDLAFTQGGLAALEREMAILRPEEMLAYATRDAPTLGRVLDSATLGPQAMALCSGLPDQDFACVCAAMSPEHFDQYVLADPALSLKVTAGIAVEPSPFTAPVVLPTDGSGPLPPSDPDLTDDAFWQSLFADLGAEPTVLPENV